jgi:hypothetical protein
MAKKTETYIEGPAEHLLHGPGDALKLPTKHYAETTAMATKGKKTEIEGPCGDCKGGYHK